MNKFAYLITLLGCMFLMPVASVSAPGDDVVVGNQQ